MKHRILLIGFFITIAFPSIAFGDGALYYTANEGGSISKVDALSNKLIKTTKLEGVVHNVQISPDGQSLGAVLMAGEMDTMKTHVHHGMDIIGDYD